MFGYNSLREKILCKSALKKRVFILDIEWSERQNQLMGDSHPESQRRVKHYLEIFIQYPENYAGCTIFNRFKLKHPSSSFLFPPPISSFPPVILLKVRSNSPTITLPISKTSTTKLSHLKRAFHLSLIPD